MPKCAIARRFVGNASMLGTQARVALSRYSSKRNCLIAAMAALAMGMPPSFAVAQSSRPDIHPTAVVTRNLAEILNSESELLELHNGLISLPGPTGELFRLSSENFQREYVDFLHEVNAIHETTGGIAGEKVLSKFIDSVKTRYQRWAKRASTPTIAVKVEAEIEVMELTARIYPAACRALMGQGDVPELPEVAQAVNTRHTLMFFAAMAEGRGRPVDHGKMTDADWAALWETLDREGLSRQEVEIWATGAWDRVADDATVCRLHARLLQAGLRTPQETRTRVLAIFMPE